MWIDSQVMFTYMCVLPEYLYIYQRACLGVAFQMAIFIDQMRKVFLVLLSSLDSLKTTLDHG